LLGYKSLQVVKPQTLTILLTRFRDIGRYKRKPSIKIRNKIFLKNSKKILEFF